MSPQPNPEMIQLTDYVSVRAGQLLGDDLPQLTEIQFLSGVMGLTGSPHFSIIGLHAADVPLNTVKNYLDPDPDSRSNFMIDRIYRRSGLAIAEDCDKTVLSAWQHGDLRVIEPITLPCENVPDLARPEGIVLNAFQMLLNGDRDGLFQKLADPNRSLTNAMRHFFGPLRLRHRATALSLGFMLGDIAPPPAQTDVADIPASQLFQIWPDLKPRAPKVSICISPIPRTSPPTAPTPEAPETPEVPETPKPESPEAPPVTPLALKPSAPAPAISPTKSSKKRLAKTVKPPRAKRAPAAPKPAPAPKPTYEIPPAHEVSPVHIAAESGTADFRIGNVKVTFDLGDSFSAEDMSIIMQSWLGNTLSESTKYHDKTEVTIQEATQRLRKVFDKDKPPASMQTILLRHLANGFVAFEGVNRQPVTLEALDRDILNFVIAGKNASQIAGLVTPGRTAVQKRIHLLKEVFGVPNSSDQMLSLAAYAAGHTPVPAPNPDRFIPANAPEKDTERVFAAYPITVHPPAVITNDCTVRIKPESIASTLKWPREDGPYIHWGGGIFKRNIPDDTSQDERLSRALALNCFGLSSAAIGKCLGVSEFVIDDLLEEGRQTYGLAYGLGISSRDLFDREWLTVEQQMDILPQKFHPRHIETLQAIQVATSMDEVASILRVTAPGAAQLAKYVRGLTGTKTATGLLTALYGMKFFMPERYYRENAIGPLPLQRHPKEPATASPQRSDKKKPETETSLPPTYLTTFTIPHNLTILPGIGPMREHQQYPPGLEPPMEDGPYLRWNGGVIKRNIPERYGLHDDAVRALALSGLGVTIADLARYVHSKKSVASLHTAASSKTRLPAGLRLVKAMFARKWLTVENYMPIPEPDRYGITLYQQEIDLLQALHDTADTRVIATLGLTKHRLGHLRKIWGVPTARSLLAAGYVMGLWKVTDEQVPDEIHAEPK